MSAVVELPATEVRVDAPKLYEIVNGKVEEKPMAGARHGGVEGRLFIPLGSFIYVNRLGGIYTSDTTFTIGANERMPDIAFVSLERIPSEGEPSGKWLIAPDLAVEIISPTDAVDDTTRKIREYFAAGVRQVWQVSAEFKTITVYRSPVEIVLLTEDDTLTCDEILPGFSLPLRDIFTLPRPV